MEPVPIPPVPVITDKSQIIRDAIDLAKMDANDPAAKPKLDAIIKGVSGIDLERDAPWVPAKYRPYAAAALGIIVVLATLWNAVRPVPAPIIPTPIVHPTPVIVSQVEKADPVIKLYLTSDEAIKAAQADPVLKRLNVIVFDKASPPGSLIDGVPLPCAWIDGRTVPYTTPEALAATLKR